MPDEKRSHGLVSVVVEGLRVGPIAERPLGNCEGLYDQWFDGWVEGMLLCIHRRLKDGFVDGWVERILFGTCDGCEEG